MSELHDLLEQVAATDVDALLRSLPTTVPFPPPPPGHPVEPPDPTSRPVKHVPVPSLSLGRAAVSARSILARHRRKLDPTYVAQLERVADEAEAELERRHLRPLDRGMGRKGGVQPL